MIEIHPTAYVSHLADIEDSKRGTRIVIGAESVIDSFVNPRDEQTAQQEQGDI